MAITKYYLGAAIPKGKEKDPFICEWCNREIKDGCIPKLGIEEKEGYTSFYWMHENCKEAAIKAIDKLIENKRIENDANENFKL